LIAVIDDNSKIGCRSKLVCLPCVRALQWLLWKGDLRQVQIKPSFLSVLKDLSMLPPNVQSENVHFTQSMKKELATACKLLRELLIRQSTDSRQIITGSHMGSKASNLPLRPRRMTPVGPAIPPVYANENILDIKTRGSPSKYPARSPPALI